MNIDHTNLQIGILNIWNSSNGREKDIIVSIVYEFEDKKEAQKFEVYYHKRRLNEGNPVIGSIGSNTSEGRKWSDEMRRKLSESHKGQIPWNKGKTNCYSEETILKMKAVKRTPWNKGKTLSEEHKRKIGESRKGKLHTEETKKLISKRMKKEI